MKRLGRLAKAGCRDVLDAIWPQRSLVSGIVGEGPVAAADFAALRFLTGAACVRCALPVDIDLGAEAECAACASRPPPWSRARAALAYDEASKPPILALKHASARDGLSVLARWMVHAGGDLLDEADVLLPVPLHYRRLAARGFNQAGWLASAVGRVAGVPVCVDGLSRVRPTPSQGTMSASARRRNVAGAFKVRASRRTRLNGRRVVLVDDVYTTGATLAACARTLKRSGADHIDVLVLARVVKDRDLTI